MGGSVSFRPAAVVRLGVPAALVAATLVAVTGSSGQAAQPQPKPKQLPFSSGQTVAYDPHSVLVKFRPKASAAARKQALSKSASKARASVAADVVAVTGTVPAPQLLKKLKADPSVELASLNYLRKATATPNDEFYAAGFQHYLPTVRMPQAWDVSKSAGAQTVAVLDTGIDAGHPDLAGRTVTGYNAVNPATGPVDDNYHGTFVSGIIAANTNNTEGIAGVAWSAKVMPVKVLDEFGTGTDEDIIEGLNWAVSHGARVVNMSFGGTMESLVLRDAVANAVAKGVVVVAAAGNTGDDVPQYPAAYPDVLSVGATNDNAAITGFSSRGDWLDLAAPGYDIVSTVPRDLDPEFPYGQASGTSFSAPIVAGVAALVRNKYPALTPAEVMARLETTARDAGPRGRDPYYGAGILDAYAALGGPWAADFTPALPDGNDFPARAQVLAGGSASASIGAEGDSDWFKIDSAAARNATVKVTGPLFDSVQFAQNFGPVLSVYDQDFRLLGHVQTPRPDEDEDGFEIPAALTATTNASLSAGVTYIKVRNSNGSRDSRPYSLTVTDSDTGGPGPTDPSFIVRDASVPDFTAQVPVDTYPSVTLSRDAAPASINTTTVRLLNGKTGAGVSIAPGYDAAARKIVITPSSPLLDKTPYRIVIDGVQEAGPAILGGYTSTFETADLTPQAVTSFDASGLYLAANLSWKIPPTTDLDYVVVRRNVGSKAPTFTTGTLVYAGTASAVKNTGLAQGTTYTFAAWVVDRSGKLSPVATTQLLGMKSGIATTSTLINYGGSITIKGSTLRIDNKVYAGLPVNVYVRPKNVSTFKLLAALKTSSTGTLSIVHKPLVSSVYMLTFPGNADLMGTRTADITVNVAPTVSSVLSPIAIRLGGITKLSGYVAPAHYAKPVYLQLYSNKTWKSIVSVKLSTSGAYAFGIKPATRGSFAYRVLFTADADHAQAVSPYRIVTVS
ncbi:S8 family serine peptidase [Kribbella sp. NPDC049174]|uniref:S8 family serine peptidase n=1 Tax=Kribbella sp. NPDC049174 TaxID=3364112 RepID=UPI0037116A68